jgi:hypothetical protein
MLYMPNVEDRLATGVFDAPASKANPSAETPAPGSFSATKRVVRTVLTMIAFAVVVTAIVALKSWIWIPHLGR